jgi:hypothetical protein
MKLSKTSTQVILMGCWKSLMGSGSDVAEITFVMGHITDNPVTRAEGSGSGSNLDPYPSVPYL